MTIFSDKNVLTKKDRLSDPNVLNVLTRNTNLFSDQNVGRQNESNPGDGRIFSFFHRPGFRTRHILLFQVNYNL